MDPLNFFSHSGVYTPNSRSMAASPYSPGSAYTVAGHLPPQALPYHQASAEDALQSALNDHHASVLFDLGLSPTPHSRNLAESLIFPGSVSGLSGSAPQPTFHHQHNLTGGSRRSESSHARRSVQSLAGVHDANAQSIANGHNTTTTSGSSTNGLPAQTPSSHRRRPSLQPPGSAVPQHSHAHPSHLSSPMAPFFLAGPDLIARPRGIFGYIPTASASSTSAQTSPSHSRNTSRDSTSSHLQTQRSSRTTHNPQQLARHRERRRISLARRRQSMAEQITAATRAADAGLRLANGLFSLSSLPTLPMERALDHDDDHDDDEDLDDSDFFENDDVDDEVLERQVIQEFRGSLNTKMVASPDAIRSLQSVKVADIPEGDRTCVICYNGYGEECPEGHREAPLRLPNCNHIFGDHCIKKWFEDSDSCPYCRNKLPAQRKHYASPRAPIVEMLQAHGWDQSRPEAQAILRRLASGGRLSMRYFVPPTPTSPESAERESQPDGVDENGRRTRQRRSYASAEVLETTRQHGSTASFDSTPVRIRSASTSTVATPSTASSPLPPPTTPSQLRPSSQAPSLRTLAYGSPAAPGPSPDTALSRATRRVILQPTSPSQAQANRQAAAALRAGMMASPLTFFSNSLGGNPGSSAGSR